MFREVRKKKNELSEEATQRLLMTERRGVLAVNGDNGYPYAIPVNYIYCKNEGKIYFHGSKAGHKADSLKNCDKVCFTVFGNESIKSEDWAPYVQSVVVFGRCKPSNDFELSMKRIRDFACKYYPNETLVDEEISASGKAVQMFEITIEHLSGKEIQEK